MGSESTAFLQEGQVVRGIGQEYGPRLPEAQVLRSRRSQNRFVKTPLYCYFFTMEMRWSRFDDLTNQELYEILALRQRVFIVEQNCAYLDADGLDFQAWHLCCRGEDGKLLAYLRILPEKTRFQEPSIGRVITAPEARGKALGKAIMIEACKMIAREFGGGSIRISAQAYLERFYTGLGFVRVGESYLEDGIPHFEMLYGKH